MNKSPNYQTPTVLINSDNKLLILYTVGNVAHGKLLQQKLPIEEWIDFTWTQNKGDSRVDLIAQDNTYTEKWFHRVQIEYRSTF